MQVKIIRTYRNQNKLKETQISNLKLVKLYIGEKIEN